MGLGTMTEAILIVSALVLFGAWAWQEIAARMFARRAIRRVREG